MTDVRRINWPLAAATGARVVRALLIAGLPFLIVPEGVTVTGVTWTVDTDTAWHVGASPTTKDWLCVRSENDPDVPALAWEENASPVQGTLDVGSLRFWLADASDGLTEVTTCFAIRDVLPFAQLTADLSAAGSTLTVDTAEAFDASGVLHIGRERVTYTSRTSTAFTLDARGTAGTKARKYAAAAKHRVYGAPPGGDESLPTLVGRRLTVWALLLDDAGGVTDPTLLYDGRIAKGVGMSPDGAFEIPVEHAIHALSTESTAPVLTVYGYDHGNAARSTTSPADGHGTERVPFWAAMNDGAGAGELFTLTSDDNSGWSATREQYLERWNRAALAGSYHVNAVIVSGGILRVDGYDSVTDRRLTVRWGWNEAARSDPSDDGDERERTTVFGVGPLAGMPQSCFWLAGKLHLDDSALAQIPAAPTYPVHAETFAFWTLTGERDNGTLPKGMVTSKIQAFDPSDDPVTADGVWLTTLTSPDARGTTSLLPWLFTRMTSFSLGLFAQGTAWWDVLRYGVLEQIDGLRGLDQVADSIDWARLIDIARRSSPHPTQREYLVDLAAPVLDLLRNEAALNGLALSTWYGRVCMASIREVATTEALDGTITTGHVRDGSFVMVREVSEGMATGYRLTLANGDTITVNDAAAIAESGAGTVIEATAPQGMLTADSVLSEELQEHVTQVALALIGPWVRPYQVATVPGDLRLADLQIGHVVTLSDWLVPNQLGGRGLDGAAATVIGKRVDYDAGTVDLKLRVSPSAVAGYAPEALVASISGAVLTLDTTTYGTQGFADPIMPDGTPRTDGGASCFTVGQYVALLELDTTTPGTPYQSTITAISGATVTLAGSPGGGWPARAASGTAKVMLVFDDYATADASQHRWAYIADRATMLLDGSTQGRRWV